MFAYQSEAAECVTHVRLSDSRPMAAKQASLARPSPFISHRLQTTPRCTGMAGDEPVDASVSPRKRCVQRAPCQAPTLFSSHLGDEPADTSVSPQKRRVSPQKRRVRPASSYVDAPPLLREINAMLNAGKENNEPYDESLSPQKGRGACESQLNSGCVDYEPDDESLSPQKGRGAFERQWDTGAAPCEDCSSFSPKKMRMVPASRGALEHGQHDTLVQQAQPSFQCDTSITKETPHPQPPWAGWIGVSWAPPGVEAVHDGRRSSPVSRPRRPPTPIAGRRLFRRM